MPNHHNDVTNCNDFTSTIIRWLQTLSLAPSACVSTSDTGSSLDAGCATQAACPSRFDPETNTTDWSGLTFNFTLVTSPVSLSTRYTILICDHTLWVGPDSGLIFSYTNINHSSWMNALVQSPFHFVDSSSQDTHWKITVSGRGALFFNRVRLERSEFHGVQSQNPSTTSETLLTLDSIVVWQYPNPALTFTGNFDGVVQINNSMILGNFTLVNAHFNQIRIGTYAEDLNITGTTIRSFYTSGISPYYKGVSITLTNSMITCDPGHTPPPPKPTSGPYYPGFFISTLTDTWNTLNSHLSNCTNFLDNPNAVSITESQFQNTSFIFEYYPYTNYAPHPLSSVTISASHFISFNSPRPDSFTRVHPLFKHVYAERLDISDSTFTCINEPGAPSSSSSSGCGINMLDDFGTGQARIQDTEWDNLGINQWNQLSSIAPSIFPGYTPKGRENTVFKDVLLMGDEVRITDSEIACTDENTPCLPSGMIITPGTEIEISECANRAQPSTPQTWQQTINPQNHRFQLGFFKASAIGMVASNVTPALSNNSAYPACKAPDTYNSSTIDPNLIFLAIAVVSGFLTGIGVFIYFKYCRPQTANNNVNPGVEGENVVTEIEIDLEGNTHSAHESEPSTDEESVSLLSDYLFSEDEEGSSLLSDELFSEDEESSSLPSDELFPGVDNLYFEAGEPEDLEHQPPSSRISTHRSR